MLIQTTALFISLAWAAVPRTIYQFPNHTWVENLAIRSSNGNILVTANNIDPSDNKLQTGVYQLTSTTKTPRLVYAVGTLVQNATFGIAELTTDIFAVSAGNYRFDFGSKQGRLGSWNIVLLNLTAFDAGLNPLLNITSVPESGTLNSVRKIGNTAVLCTDSGKGGVWKVDVTGETNHFVILNDTASMSPEPPRFFGIDGSRAQTVNGQKHLFYSAPNKTPAVVARVPINADGFPTGNFTVYDNPSNAMIDDLDVDKNGTMYGGTSGNIVRVAFDGIHTNLASVNSSTATQLSVDERRLYFTTSGFYLVEERRVSEGGRLGILEL